MACQLGGAFAVSLSRWNGSRTHQLNSSRLAGCRRGCGSVLAGRGSSRVLAPRRRSQRGGLRLWHVWIVLPLLAGTC